MPQTSPSSDHGDTLQSVPAHRTGWDRLLIALVIAVLLGVGFVLWNMNGAGVFTEAMTGLWALCF